MWLYARPPRRRFETEQLEQRRLLSSGGWDVALIDKTLPSTHVLARAMAEGGRVILYDGRRESAHQVLSRLLDWADESGRKLQSLSLLSHASAGRFQLGNQWISNSSVDETELDLERLGRAFSDNGRVNLFGCNLAARAGTGQALIDKIAELTGAAVFASDDITGRGGDWVLEASSANSSDQVGFATSGRAITPFSVRLLKAWGGTLAAAGITVTPTSGLVTTESGGTATFTVKLDTNPGGGGGNAVSIGISSSNVTEGTVSPATLTFNNTNWNVPQTVTVTGVDDLFSDGNVAYSIITAPAVSGSAGYSGLDAANVSITNVDNDTPGITVSPTSGLTTNETGGAASFNVQLNSQPTANVTIPLSSSNTGEGTVSAASLTFTVANWNTPQTVTVTGVDESVDDGDIAYSVVTGAATSSDGNYNGLNASDVSVANTDNDTAGITVSPTSGLVTTEAGGTAPFTVVLNSKPLANVVVGISSTSAAEGTVSVSSLTFTPANWNTPQTITVTGANDSVDDGDVAYSIVTAAGSTTDPLYNGLNPSDVSVTNTDDDTAGVTVSPTSGLTTAEAGGGVNFTIVLTSQPMANVTIGLTSSNSAEGTVSASSLLFTATNWNVAQTVTITGVDDFVDDGNIGYSIVTAAAVSADVNYSGLNPADVNVSNSDDDTAGILVIPTSGLTSTEAGGTTSFSVVLTSQPIANVTIPLSSSNTAEGTISTANLVFAAVNWNSPQTVTVTGVDDLVDDGDVAYSIITAAAMSGDSNYSGMNAADVSVTNADDDTAGITVSPTSGLTTTEAGGTASFTVVLDSKPTANVSIGIASGNSGEGTVSTSSLTFTPANWNAPQTVTITGVNDPVDDGNVTCSVVTAAATSADPNYNGRNATDVSITNTDDDTAGVNVSPTSGLVTTEAGGTASFTVALDSQPTADVVINLSSSNTAEGTASPSSLTFTAATWSTPQTVTVHGVDDSVDDGDVAYNIVTAAASSADVIYNGLNVANVSLMNSDNDASGVTLSPTSGLTTTEAGGTASFAIALNTQPTANVTIGLSSDDTAEGTISAGGVTFTAADWNVPQTITVSGADDFVDDGNIAYSIVTAGAASADPNYSGLNADDVSLTNVDNDTAGVSVSPMSGLGTTEAGGTASFDVVLDSKPTASVVIGISTNDAGEGIVSASSLTFTAGNWNTPQTITVTGVDDSVDDGDVTYTVVTAAALSGDSNYNGLSPNDVSVTNTDNDTAGITVSPTSGLSTTEAGGTATFSVVLDSQPTADVSIGLSSSNTAEGTVAPASVQFTAGNWNVPQIITVTGVDDSVDDGDIVDSIVTAAAASADPNYSGRNAADVSVTNIDDDTAGITVSPTSGLITTEAGGTASFTMVLTSQPTASVNIGLSSSDTGEASLSVPGLTFTAVNWNVPQTVTITGVDDFADDGDTAYTIVTAAATSGDANYGGMSVADVSATNTDNDTAGVTVTPTSGLNTSEVGGSDSFSVVLTSRPDASVSIGLSSSDTGEALLSDAGVTFTAANWNVPQTVTITGVDDFEDDGDTAYTIVTAAATSGDANYAGLSVADVSATNTDNDTAGVTVTPTSGLNTSEVGGSESFSVVITSQPTASVLIDLSSSNAAEGVASTGRLTFTPGNWNVTQIVTVTGVDGSVDDDDVAYSIITADASSADANYNGMAVSDVSVTNADDDTAGFTFTPDSNLTATEAGGAATFTVVLNSRPTASVSLGLSSSDITEGTVSPAGITFTAGNWNVPQTVTVTGVDDFVSDGNVNFMIVTAAATSTDPKYGGLNPPDVSATTIDDETAGITVIPTAALVTTEAGGTASFGVQLNTQPMADVVISLASSNAAEGTVSASSLVFTSANWNIPQMATITGVDDDVDDGNVTYSIMTSAASSADPGYDGMAVPDVSVTSHDNDTAAVSVTPTSGLVTTEAGGSATFSAVLTSRPNANVMFSLASSDTGEGTVSVSSLSFTPANWNVVQIVTLAGQDDPVDDGNVGYSVIIGAVSSADPGYNGIDPADVSATNTDDDQAGFILSPTSGLVTTEAGTTATFTIALNSQPTANVTVPLGSSDNSEGTASVSNLLFTAANWNTPQTVTLTGVNDFIDDGDIAYSIITAAAISADGNYNGANPTDVAATNIDNDTAGITVSPTSGLVTSEAGATASFTIVLNSQPTANVTIPLGSSNTAEGALSVASVTFTAANWDTPQTVTSGGVDDLVDDGDVDYNIITGAATSSDGNYSGMNADDVSVTNIDDDTAGIVVSPTVGLTTTEAGGTANFSIALASKPTANVTIGLSSSNTAEGALSTASVTFTAANWNVPQSVTLTGVDDAFDDGDIAYTIVTAAATSGDGNYNGIDPSDISVANTDDDTAGISVSPPSGLTTTEAGGGASFAVVLTSRPLANVTIGLASDDISEGVVSLSSVTFTPANWNTPQTVTVTGADGSIDDGDIAYNIITAAATSADANYNGQNAADVALTNVDDDTAGITVSPTSGLVTTEAGSTASFTIVLNSQPTANVTIPLNSSNTGEGTISTASVTFTAGDWNVPRTVTITGVDDQVDDGNVAYAIVAGAGASADSSYSGLNAADVSATNTNNDTAGITVSPTSGLITTEAGGSTSFTIVLSSRPTASVSIAFASSNTAEGMLSPAGVIFTTANWNTPQTVTVTGVNDFVHDGDVGYSIVTAAATSGDPTYNGMNAADVTATNLDNDTAGIAISPTSGLTTTEAGGAASFTIVLTSQPTADVTIPVDSSNTAEGTLSAASVTFTNANWNAPQTVTITGVDDSVDDGNTAYSIVTAATVSADVDYDGVNAADVSVTNTDNDTAGITVSPTSPLVTSEAGATATFTIVLDSQPTADVFIALSSNNPGEGSPSVAGVTFTSGNWNTPKTVMITGVDDSIDDGNVAYSIITAAAASADANYNGTNAPDVSATNMDDDAAGITVTPTLGLTTTEAGGAATFMIRLDSEPTANVTIAVSSSNLAEGTVSPGSMIFTTANWDTPQVVTITGMDDPAADGDIAYSIFTAAAASADANYDRRNAADVSLHNIDDDVAGITVTPTTSLVTSEAGGAATFTVVLNSRPTANVVVGIASSKTAEGTVSLSSLTFTPGNWNTAQSVTITGADDLVDDGDVGYSIVTTAAVSSDAGYSGLNAIDVSVTNTDNDAAGFTVVPAAGLVTTEAGGTASFTVALTSRPTADVTVAFSSSNPAEGAPSVSTLVFTPANWNAAQTVMLGGIDDEIADGNVAYTIFTTSSSADATYNSIDPPDVAATNLDDDFAGITVTPNSGLSTTEAGGTATFTVVLQSQPTANVTVPISSSDISEGTGSSGLLTFTPTNWYLPQTVTVQGVDDLIRDGDAPFSVITGSASSPDPSYNGLAADDVSVTNSDDDVAEVRIAPVAGLVTTEAGGTASFTIVLTSQPTSSVTVNLSSSNVREGVLSANSVNFNPSDWSVPQVVTIAGANDLVQDGAVAYTVITAATVSGDPIYSGVNGADVSVTNLDNDVAGVTVTPASGLVTSEAGGTAQFAVVLDAQPSADVRIGVASSRPGEAAVAVNRLVFTSTNWNVPQIVTVAGEDDSRADGAQSFSVALARVVSADMYYDGLKPADVAGTNADDDAAGILVTPTSGLVTREIGTSASFTVVLQSQPSANVTLGVSSSNTAEGTVSVPSLIFTPSNWNVPQSVTVTGVDDTLPDSDRAYSVVLAPAISGDADYSDVDPTDVALTNIDNDTIGISVVPTSGLTTSEVGTSVLFNIALTKQPSASVTLLLQSSNPAEGIVSRSGLTFTPDNWDTPRQISVSGVNDLVDDGDTPYELVVSISATTDVDYAALSPKVVTLTNSNDDTAGVTVTPVTSPVTSESGGTASFDVVLNSQPTADVALALTSGNPIEGSLATATLRFTPVNWDQPQRLTVQGLDDQVMDGDVVYPVLLRPSADTLDAKYAAVGPQAIYLTNVDDDEAGFTITPRDQLSTSERGASGSFDMVLNSQPRANVVLSVTSSNESEGRPRQAMLTFTLSDWNVPQRVTVDGVDDHVVDDDRNYRIDVEVSSATADSDYLNVASQSVQLGNSDDDTAGFVLIGADSALVTTEAGGAAHVTLSLSSQPTSEVELAVTSNNSTEGRTSQARLIYTPANWNLPQTIEVRGQDDAADDGDAIYQITISTDHSADPAYVALPPASLTVTNIDDDAAGVIVKLVSTLGRSLTYAVSLGSQPASDVLILPSVTAAGGTTWARELRFSPQNWNQPQFVTFLAEQGTQTGQPLLVSTAASSDPQYNGLRSMQPLAPVPANVTVASMRTPWVKRRPSERAPLDLDVIREYRFMPPVAAAAPRQLPSHSTECPQVVPLRLAFVPGLPATDTATNPQEEPEDAPLDRQEDSDDAPPDSSGEPTSPTPPGPSTLPAGTTETASTHNDITARQVPDEVPASFLPQVAPQRPQWLANAYRICGILAAVLVAPRMAGILQRYSRAGRRRAPQPIIHR